jgi:glucan 1,3-beta-glucosidase
MKLIHATTFLSFLLGAASVQFKIPEVEEAVGKVLKEFGGYVGYHGNHSESSATSKRQSADYWYETITHQGISAFGPSGYQVYRNVMDFGATGKSQLQRVRKCGIS